MVRGKFRLQSVLSSAGQTGSTLTFSAVCLEDKDNVEENKKYHKYTPNGSISMYVDNPSAQEQFELGRYYYVDFTKCETQ